MPYKTIKSAEEAKFPTVVDDVPLTLGQINRLAELYDAIKESGSADSPMAVAMTQWKKEHRKSDDTWIKAELEFFGAEMPADNYDPKTHIVKAIRVGTIATVLADGSPWECTKNWMTSHATDWGGGHVIANHNGANSEVFGDINRSWYEDPFIFMELSNMNPEAERRMLANEHTGFSFDAMGIPSEPDTVVGTNLSILFFPHNPACSTEAGCGLAAEDADLQSHNVTTEDKTILGSESMGENKSYSDSEIDAIKAESAEVAKTLATFEAEAKTHESEISAYKAEISTRNDKISELTETADTLFAAEDVEKKIEEAKATMFSAEDVEAAKTEAIELAIAAEKERVDSIASELAVANQMFPDGVAEDFHAEIDALIKDGKSHEAFVKLGDVDFKSFKASIPTVGEKTSAIVTEDGDSDGFTVGDCKGV